MNFKLVNMKISSQTIWFINAKLSSIQEFGFVKYDSNHYHISLIQMICHHKICSKLYAYESESLIS